MSAKYPAAPHFLLLVAVLATLSSPLVRAADDAAIARIEAGLRPPIALSNAPVETETLQHAMARLNVPGVSVAVIKGGKVAWSRGYGVAWVGGPAITPRTLFQAASVSKPVTTMAALRMVEQGQLDLDADINTSLTSWKLPEGKGKPSARQLLSHTGGMTVSGFPGYAAGKPVPTLVEVLDGAGTANTKAIRVDAVPGSAFRYSGGGYTVLQQAMIDRSGKPFDALLRQSVLTPLGMRDSSFSQPLPAALQAQAARPHLHDGKPYPGGAYTYPELAAAGLWTTPEDLAKFVIAVQQGAAGSDKGVISAAMTRTMLTPVMGDYGLGLQIRDGGKAFEHSGSNMGFKAGMVGSLDSGDGAVILTNGDQGGELVSGLLRAIAHEYKWKTHQTRLRTTVTLPTATVKSLVGHYKLDGLPDFHIAERDGQLMIALRPDQWEPLYAESDKLLFVLSRNLEILPTDANSGYNVMGASKRAYKRADS
jgi:CubicO group peptidase (beta-lactamase class C family)